MRAKWQRIADAYNTIIKLDGDYSQVLDDLYSMYWQYAPTKAIMVTAAGFGGVIV